MPSDPSAPAASLPVSIIHTDTGYRLSWTEVGIGPPLLVSSPAAIPVEYWQPLLRALADTFRVIFVHPRGLWGSALPSNLRAVSVCDHAADLAFLVRSLAIRDYAVLAHCIGATPVIAALSRLAFAPRTALLVSNRFERGAPLQHLDGIIERMRRDDRFRKQYAGVAAAYAPAAIRTELEVQLRTPDELEAHIRAVQSTREYAYQASWPREIPVTLVRASGDSAEIRRSTLEYATSLGAACLGVVDVVGSHCWLQEAWDEAQTLVIDRLSPMVVPCLP